MPGSAVTDLKTHHEKMIGKGRESWEKLVDRRELIARKWIPNSEMYSLLYGQLALGAAAALSNAFIMMRFRKFLHLRSKALLTSAVSGVMLPSGALILAQHQLVGMNIMSIDERSRVCPTCMEGRAMAMQWVGGIGLPVVTQAALQMFMASQYTTQAVPLPSQLLTSKQFLVGGMMKGMGLPILVMSILQVLAAMTVVRYQFRSMEKILEFERKREGPDGREVLRQQLVESLPGAQTRVVIRH